MSHGKNVRFILSILIMSALFEGFFRNTQKSQTSKSIPSFTERHSSTNSRSRGRFVKHRMPCVVLEMPGIAMRASLETKSFHFSFGALWHYDILSQRKIFGEMYILQIKKLRNLHTKVQKGGGFLKTWYQKNNHFVSYIINDHFGVELGVPPFKGTPIFVPKGRTASGPWRATLPPDGPLTQGGNSTKMLRLTVSLTWYTCMKMYYRYKYIYICAHPSPYKNIFTRMWKCV